MRKIVLKLFSSSFVLLYLLSTYKMTSVVHFYLIYIL